jgi:hypothetical protein
MASRTTSRQSAASFDSTDAQDDPPKEKQTFVGFVKKIWGKTGLDRPTVLLMMKYVCMNPCQREFGKYLIMENVLLIVFPEADFRQLSLWLCE